MKIAPPAPPGKIRVDRRSRGGPDRLAPMTYIRPMCGSVVSCLLCLFAAQQPVALEAGPTAQPAADASVRLEDSERRLGPFQIQDRRFTVVLRIKRILGVPAPDPAWQTTLAAIEIEDEAGAVHYRRSFDYEVSGNEFADCWSASAKPLQGEHGSGLLVSYGVFPSAPLAGQSFQVFGLFEGRLVPLSKPVSVEGDLLNAQSAEPVIRTSEEPGRQLDALHFRVWTGSFFVVYPVLVDWLPARLTPAWRCLKMTSRGQRAPCRYRVQAERVARDEELTFVRLHAEPEEGAAAPRHVVVKPDSTVEFLEAEGEIRWVEDDAGVALVAGEDFWIRVRIDGRDGWIHTDEDLLEIGLLQAG